MESDTTSPKGPTRTGPPESFGLSTPAPARPGQDNGPDMLSRIEEVEGARPNPPIDDLQQRSMAREAYAVLQDYIDTWQPHYQPKKLQLTTWWKDTSRQYNVLRADARLMGFEDPLTPLHFLFFSSPRISRAAGKYSSSVKDVSGIEEHEPGLWIRFFNEDWIEEGKVVEKEEITDSEHLREHGSRALRGEMGIPQLSHSFATVSKVLEHIQEESVRRRAATLDVTPSPPDPQELTPEKFVDEVVSIVRKDSPYSMTNDADKAEQAVREAVGNLRALKRQLAHILQERKSTFIHEFQHHFDRSRMPDDAIVGSTTVKDRLGLPTSNYWNADIEVNARFQQGLAEFEEVMLSDPNFLRSKIEGDFDARDLIRLLKQFTPAYEKLNEKNQRRLITRWTKYYNQIVEPRIERLKEEMSEEGGGGLPEDLQALLDAAETLADAQATFEAAIEEAGGPLSRSMDEDRRLDALDTKIREGFSTLREKAEKKGYDFDTILERTPLEPVRENPPYVRPEELARENPPDPQAKRHLERHGEILDPDLYVTGFPGEPENTMTEEGIEGAKFKLWFGDWQDPESDHSVVTDEDGSPMKVYHGTRNGGFNRFMLGADLRDRGSPGVFFTESRPHARSYSGSNEDIAPSLVGPSEITNPNFGFEVEVVRVERRAYEVVDEGGEVVDTVLEESLRFPDVLDEYEEEGYEIKETEVDRYDVIHRGVQVLYNGTENEKIVAIEKIAQEANDRAEIPPQQEKGILTAYLNIRDPLVLDFEGETWEDPPPNIDFFSIDGAARFAMNAGYDALIAKNVWDPGAKTRFADTATEYIVFNGNQVAVQGARSSSIAIPRGETDPRLNPDEDTTTGEAMTERKNPMVEAETDTGGTPQVVDAFFVDVTTEVTYPSPGTDSGFRLEAPTLGETYAYGFARRKDFDGEEYEGLAELGWIEVEDQFRGQGVGLRLLGDVLRFLAATGASHVAVRTLSDAARGLNERAENLGLWHRSMESDEGMEMYAIDIGPKSRLGVPVTGRDFEFDADRDDVEDAVQFLYAPSDVARAGAQPTEARPYTYVQPLRPAASSGDLESEYNRDVEVYETFRDAPDVSQENGFFFRTDAPITVDDLTRTSAEPVGIDSRTWTLANAANSYQNQPEQPEFAIINRDRKWLMEIEQGEGEDDGKTLVTFSRAGNRRVETHKHPSLQDALEETLRFVDDEEEAEYLPLEFVDTALDQWEAEERENPVEGLTEEGVAKATRMLAYEIRRHLWEQGRLTLNDDDAIGDLLSLADRIEEGEVDVDPLALHPIPTEEIHKGTNRDLESALESVGDLRTVEEFAGEEVIPFVEEGMEVEPFDPYAESNDVMELLKRQLPEAPRWQETGYLTPDGTPLSLGGSGVRRFKDHRDPHVPDRLIPDWLNPRKNIASMVALMEAGAIRVITYGGELGVDMNREPTPDQKQWIREAILSVKPPGQVLVDVSTPGESATESDSARLSPDPREVIRFIEDFYSDEGGSKVARFRRQNPAGTLSQQMARLYPSWKPKDQRSKIDAQDVKWIMPGGQAIGAAAQEGEEVHHNHFELPEEFEADSMPRRELVDRGALSVWVTAMSGLDHVSVNVVSGSPITEPQKTTLRSLVAEIGADKVVGALSDARGEDLDSVPSTQVEADSAGAFLERADEFYGSGTARSNPDTGDSAFVLAVGEDQSANLQNFKPQSQKIVVMSPGKYLKHAREYFGTHPDTDHEKSRRAITRKSPAVSPERIEEMKERMRGRKPLDALWFDVRVDAEGRDTPNIIGQEGRHRAIAANELGIRHVPVILYAHRQKKGKGMFGGVGNVKVPAEGETFPERIMAGATEIGWPETSTPTKILWREAKFGREFV